MQRTIRTVHSCQLNIIINYWNTICIYTVLQTILSAYCVCFSFCTEVNKKVSDREKLVFFPSSIYKVWSGYYTFEYELSNGHVVLVFQHTKVPSTQEGNNDSNTYH